MWRLRSPPAHRRVRRGLPGILTVVSCLPPLSRVASMPNVRRRGWSPTPRKPQSSWPSSTGLVGLHRQFDPRELSPGGDTEFHEDLTEVLLDGARRDVEVGRDLLASLAGSGEPCDLCFLWGEDDHRYQARTQIFAGGREL